jgi:hypothetical protein
MYLPLDPAAGSAAIYFSPAGISKDLFESARPLFAKALGAFHPLPGGEDRVRESVNPFESRACRVQMLARFLSESARETPIEEPPCALPSHPSRTAKNRKTA